jgi:hypothetical protein
LSANGKIVLRVFAGLGNQQFQYAFAKALSLKYNKELIIDNSYFLKRYFPIEQFNGAVYPYKLKEYTLIEHERHTNVISRELMGMLNRYGRIQKLYQAMQNLPLISNLLPTLVTHENFLEEWFHENKTFLISGYFQKYSFFEEFADDIREKLTYKKELSNENQRYLEEIKSNSTVSVHIRRGDYIEKKNVANHFAKVTAVYFNDAIKYISSKAKIDKLVVFSDDIQWVKDNLRFDYECIYIENDGPDFQHQYLMSQCNHNIISNSTYSWWGAWLNPDKEKIVCAPERWFANEKRKNDIYIPQKWRKIGND